MIINKTNQREQTHQAENVIKQVGGSRAALRGANYSCVFADNHGRGDLLTCALLASALTCIPKVLNSYPGNCLLNLHEDMQGQRGLAIHSFKFNLKESLFQFPVESYSMF